MGDYMPEIVESKIPVGKSTKSRIVYTGLAAAAAAISTACIWSEKTPATPVVPNKASTSITKDEVIRSRLIEVDESGPGGFEVKAELKDQYERHRKILENIVLNEDFIRQHPLRDWWPAWVYKGPSEESHFRADGMNISISNSRSGEVVKIPSDWIDPLYVVSIYVPSRRDGNQGVDLFLAKQSSLRNLLQGDLLPQSLIVRGDKRELFLRQILNVSNDLKLYAYKDPTAKRVYGDSDPRVDGVTGSYFLPNENYVSISANGILVSYAEYPHSRGVQVKLGQALDRYLQTKGNERFLIKQIIPASDQTNGGSYWEINNPFYPQRGDKILASVIDKPGEPLTMVISGQVPVIAGVELPLIDKTAYKYFKVHFENSKKEMRGFPQDEVNPNSQNYIRELEFTNKEIRYKDDPEFTLTLDDYGHFGLTVINPAF